MHCAEGAVLEVVYRKMFVFRACNVPVTPNSLQDNNTLALTLNGTTFCSLAYVFCSFRSHNEQKSLD